MYLPEQLQEQSFMTWNHTVKGLMRVWEIANKFGMGERLEERLRDDPSCELARLTAEIGNDPRRLADMYREFVSAARLEESLARTAPLYGVVTIRDDEFAGAAHS
jgi:hypothetical protein